VHTELESLADLDAHVAATGGLRHCAVKNLDLRTRDEQLAAVDVVGAVFLGSALGPATLARAQHDRAVVFPSVDGLPFDPYRADLYTPDELYAGHVFGEPGSYRRSLDARIDAWSAERSEPDVVDVLYRRLHDHAISDALAEAIAGLEVVGVMGGHVLDRDDPGYRAVAELGRALARARFLVVTGGGPGAMEAANLGAFCAPLDDTALDRSLGELAAAPSPEDIDGWLSTAERVTRRWGSDCGPSIGIPTWHYGHEPPNRFATRIAKYFENSVREDGLLTIAEAGIVFTPGGAGTVQEIFQDAAQNEYAEPDRASPMVFLGVDAWRVANPVYPLLEQLSAGSPAAAGLLLTDDVSEVIGALVAHRDRKRR